MRCINDHNQFVVDDEWEDNPYNIAQGGPCTAPLSFFTDSTEKTYSPPWRAICFYFCWILTFLVGPLI
jgi:hypothetical protein